MYVHMWHVDGEKGEVDYELILGPYDGAQLTYTELRETRHGETIARLHDTYWRPVSDGPDFSDVTFSEERPESIVA